MPSLKFDPNHTALLIADAYAEGMALHHATSRGCLENILKVREAARKAGFLICNSATVFRSGYREVSDRNKSFGERKHSGTPAPTDPLKIIHKSLWPAEDEVLIPKHRVNALYGTDLEMILRANNIDTLILLGFATSGVILSTTRYAADADFKICLVEDCCADRDSSVHDFLFEKIYPRQAEIVQSAVLVSVL